MGDWDGVRLWGGGDAVQVRTRLAAGADPGAAYGYGGQTVLHAAAELATPEVVAAMASAARELDRLAEGRSALWLAVPNDMTTRGSWWPPGPTRGYR
jgi:hypothetical protein